MSSATSQTDAEARAAANLRGIAWMLVTGMVFVIFTGIVRHVGSVMQMDPMQAAFIRYAFGLCILAPVFWRLRAKGMLTRRLPLHAVRGFVHGVGVLLWFFAMTTLPIAEVTALGFIAPIFTTIGAALFLGEKLHVRRIGAVLIGFGGTLIILRPGIEVIAPGAIAQLIGAPLFAMSFIVTKRLTETESNMAIVAYLAVFVTLTLLPPALWVWRTPGWAELGWLFVAAGLATLGHLCLTQAIRSAQMTVLQPVFFLQLVWATLIGIYIFGEEPDFWTWVGGAVVVASASYIAHREARADRRAVTAPITPDGPGTVP